MCPNGCSPAGPDGSQGLGAIFPREPELIGALFRYVRYVSMVLWAVWLAPWTFVKLRLA